MTVTREYTPLPPQMFEPVRVTVSDWFDLAAGDRYDVLSHRTFRNQIMNIESIGGRPEVDVRLNATATAASKSGEVTEVEQYDSSALGAFDEPITAGPMATKSIDFRVDNNGGTDYTQASANDPYQFYTNYTIRDLTVLEKLRRNIPLNDTERRLADKYNLTNRERANLPPEEDVLYEPNTKGKRVITNDSEVSTVDITSTGRTNGVEVMSENVPGDEVYYITDVSVNGDEFNPGDNLRLGFSRGGNQDFYRLNTWAMPGAPYTADLHIPVLEEASVVAFADNTITNVDVRIEWDRVQRTLVEKAMHGLEEQIISNDDLAQYRTDTYHEIRDRLRAGVRVNETELAMPLGGNGGGR